MAAERPINLQKPNFVYITVSYFGFNYVITPTMKGVPTIAYEYS